MYKSFSNDSLKDDDGNNAAPPRQVIEIYEP